MDNKELYYRIWCCLVLVLLLTPTVRTLAQNASLAFTLDLPDPYPFESRGSFGHSIASVPDINNDGYTDIAIGDPGGANQEGNITGVVYVYSGKNGALLRRIEHPETELGASLSFGVEVQGIPDLDGDGRGDILARSASNFSVNNRSGLYAFNGYNGNQIFSIVTSTPMGFSVANTIAVLTDRNRPNNTKVAVATPEKREAGSSTLGRVDVFTGRNHTLLYSVYSPDPQDFGFFAESIIPVPDANSDGIDDLLVGAYGEDSEASTTFLGGRAYLFSGSDGSLLYTISSPSGGGLFGISMSGIPDINGDDLGDFIVAFTGRNYVFDGSNGRLEYTMHGTDVTLGMHDITGDGLGDIASAVFDPTTGNEQITLYSGSDGSEITGVSVPRGVGDLAVSRSASGDTYLWIAHPYLSEGDRIRVYRISDATNNDFNIPPLQGWSDLEALKADYDLKSSSIEAPYSHQYWCIARESCAEYEQSGETGWAGGFVQFLFDYMDNVLNGNNGSKYDCDNKWFSTTCFAKAGEVHITNDLEPGFKAYCNIIESLDESNRIDAVLKWNDDHNIFLNRSVRFCIDEIASAGEIPGVFAGYIKNTIVSRAVLLRETTQEICNLSPPLIAKISSPSDSMNFPPMLSMDELHNPGLEIISDFRVGTYDNDFFLSVGKSYSIVLSEKTSGSPLNINNLSYSIDSDSDVATIGTDGVLTIHKTPRPYSNMVHMVHVSVSNGEMSGIGQFALVDHDSDGDHIVDSFEESIGLDPYVSNASTDTDGDGLSDIFEVGYSNPLDSDSDNDGFSDKVEFDAGSSPTSPESIPTAVEPRSELPHSSIFTSLYPNPFSHLAQFSLSVHRPQQVRVEVFSVLGRKVAFLYDGPLPSLQEHRFTLDGSDLPAGLYLIRAQGEHFSTTRKAVIVR